MCNFLFSESFDRKLMDMLLLVTVGRPRTTLLAVVEVVVVVEEEV